ncbi:MAG: M28 family peptidase [Thermoanaerobaculia bacterium]
MKVSRGLRPHKNATPLLLACTVLAAGCAPAPREEAPTDAAAADVMALPEGASSAAQAIDPAALRAAVGFLADDLLEGRGPSTRGDALTQLYLARTMELLGLQPGGPGGSWLQPFDIVSVEAEVPERWTFLGPRSGLNLDFWDDFIAASGVQDSQAVISAAEVVFVGYGIQAPEYQWDDFKGADLSGKVLLMLNNDPDWDPDLFEGERRLYYGRWDYKYESAARQGATGAIIIHTTPSAGYPYNVVQTGWTGPQFELPAGDEPRTQVHAWVSEEAARRLVELTGHDLDELIESAHSRDFMPVPLDITTSLKLENTVTVSQTANVAGLVPGSDPQLADEVVVFSAHHDHFGHNEPDPDGDDIYNGALDNASGCAEVLSIAKAATHLPEPPRRSLLFLFVAGEEQGLLGSQYYAEHPTFPAGRIAANINLDGANIWGRTRDLTYIGYGKSSLDALVDAAAAAQGRTVEPDQFPDRGSFYRSDQFNFAKIGVPAFYPDSGTDFIDRPDGWGRQQLEAWEEEHYHQPSDELTDEWNFEGMVEDTRLAFEVGLAVAEADEMPTWNEGDEFADERAAALAQVARDDEPVTPTP